MKIEGPLSHLCLLAFLLLHLRSCGADTQAELLDTASTVTTISVSKVRRMADYLSNINRGALDTETMLGINHCLDDYHQVIGDRLECVMSNTRGLRTNEKKSCIVIGLIKGHLSVVLNAANVCEDELVGVRDSSLIREVRNEAVNVIISINAAFESLKSLAKAYACSSEYYQG